MSTHALDRDRETDRWLMILLMLFAVLVRAPIASRNFASLRADVDNYRQFARNLLEHGTYGPREGEPSAYRPPLYPLLLVPSVRDFDDDFTSVVVCHVVLGLSAVWLTAVAGNLWGLGRARFVAAAFVACDPILLKQSTVIMTETLAATMAALALVALTMVVERPNLARALGAGVVLGLTVLCRPAFLVFVVATLPTFIWLLPRAKQGLRIAAIVTVAMVVTLAPWTIRNWIQFGRPIVTTTHGGFTLALANNPQFYAHLRVAPYEPWDAERDNWAGVVLQYAHTPEDELADNRECYALAWQTIRDEPRMFLRACGYRLSRLWGVLPLTLPEHEAHEARLRYPVAGFYLVEFGLALLGLYQVGRKLLVSPWIFALLLAASFTLVHACYWTDMRMRAPLVPAVALAAAAGTGLLAGQISRRKGSLPKDLQSPARA